MCTYTLYHLYTFIATRTYTSSDSGELILMGVEQDISPTPGESQISRREAQEASIPNVECDVPSMSLQESYEIAATASSSVVNSADQIVHIPVRDTRSVDLLYSAFMYMRSSLYIILVFFPPQEEQTEFPLQSVVRPNLSCMGKTLKKSYQFDTTYAPCIGNDKVCTPISIHICACTCTASIVIPC